MTKNIVTNAGPLMVFSKLHILHLLKEFYSHVNSTTTGQSRWL
ncbi:hypothetical protein QUF76_11600 [Desulfobacterales bacterium HSG16]|nr:hypothetical protein [Desulfobacterales bacterium HSG16]